MLFTLSGSTIQETEWPFWGEVACFVMCAVAAHYTSWFSQKFHQHPKSEAFCSTGSLGRYTFILSLQRSNGSSRGQAAKEMRQLIDAVKRRAEKDGRTILLGGTWFSRTQLEKRGFRISPILRYFYLPSPVRG
jgi:hypothetical protein